MIISHLHKFIFIKTLKTAGTSIEIALSQYLGPNDIITPISPNDELMRRDLGFHGPQNHYIPLTKYKKSDFLSLVNLNLKKFYNHMPANEIMISIDPKIWNKYYKFCVERNPWDKVISYYYWTGGASKYSSLTSFVNSSFIENIQNFDMYANKDKVIVDDIFRFESLHNLERKLTQIIGQPLKLNKYMAKVNSSKPKKHFSIMFSDNDRKLIESLFSNEIQLMNYEYGTI